MARNTGSVVKQSRKLGIALSNKAAKFMERRPYGPGQHGKGKRSKVSEYGLQLKEKQKMKFIYGVLERQFRNYFEKATGMKGKTGDNLVKLLEQRLDNVVYRCGFAPSRSVARELVSHGHIDVKGRRVTIPSYRVRAGDVVSVHPSSREHPRLRELKASLDKYAPPSWLLVDAEKIEGTVKSLPAPADTETIFDVGLVVDYYSK